MPTHDLESDNFDYIDYGEIKEIRVEKHHPWFEEREIDPEIIF